jgi:hypothetical protein
VQTLRLFKGPRARDNTIAYLEQAAKFLRETDDRDGARVASDDAEGRRAGHACGDHKECEDGCRFYILTTVDFCEHCGQLPAGSAGYMDGGTSWCVSCGESMVNEGPTVQS